MSGVGLRLLRALEWRLEADGVVLLRDSDRDEWARLAPWTRGVLEGLESGLPLGELVANACARPDAPAPARVRRLLLGLRSIGYVAIDLAPPAGLPDRYQIKREIGRGGIGVAYLATDAENGRSVVVKLPWDFLFPLEATSEMLRREARNLTALAHPRVVALHAVLDAGGVPALVREHVDGETLASRFDGHAAAPEQVTSITREVAELMRYAHAQGHALVDNKPGNFMIERTTGRIVLLDAGHARPFIARESGRVRARGSPGFTPPELLDPQADATPASDVWGLGRLHAFLLTGRLTRGRDNLDDVLRTLPAASARALARVCAAEPKQRPELAAAEALLVAALDAV